MYISHKKNKNKTSLGLKGQFHLSREERNKKTPVLNVPEKSFQDNNKALEAPHDMLIGIHSEDDLLSWRSPEFERLEKDKKWYLMVVAILLGIIAYSIFVDGIIMAITFILIGAVGYIYINKSPRILNFIITENGIIAGREIYEFDNLQSFWIFYEPASPQEDSEQWIKILSLHTKSLLLPYVHIPISDLDPVLIRETLLNFIPEEKHESGISEVLSRLLKI